MLRWFKKDGSNGNGKDVAAPDDDWAYLRAQPDFDAEEMADVRAPGAAEDAGYSAAWSDESRYTENSPAYAANSYHEAPAPVAAPAWQAAPDSRPSFSSEGAPELPLSISCGNSVMDECLRGSVLIGKLDLDREVFPEIDLSLDRDISPRHAMILLRASGFVLKDVGSETGTFLNGRRLSLGEESPLAPGDEIRLGAISSLLVPSPAAVQDDEVLSDEDLALAELAMQASGAMPLPTPRFAAPPITAAEPSIPAAPMDLLDLALIRGESLAAGGDTDPMVATLPRRDFAATDLRSAEVGDFDRPVSMTARWSAHADESTCDR